MKARNYEKTTDMQKELKAKTRFNKLLLWLLIVAWLHNLDHTRI
jgi:hypothetical protein